MAALTNRDPRRFILPLLLIGGVVAIKLLLRPLMGDGTPVLLFFSAIVISTWLGGLQSGLFAMILAAACVKLFFLRGDGLSVERVVQTAIFMAEALLLTILTSIRHGAEEKLHLRERQQAVVAALGRKAIGGESPQVLMESAASEVARTLGVEYCKILELQPDGHSLLLRAGTGWKQGLVGSVVIDADLNSQAGFTLHVKEPTIVHDLATETRFTNRDAAGYSLLHDHQVCSGVSVIIGDPNRPGGPAPWGVLGAHSRRRVVFTRDDMHFLQAMADVLAASLERSANIAALSASEARSRAFFAAAPDLMFRMRGDGVFLELLSGSRNDLLLEPSEFLYRNLCDVLPPDLSAQCLACLRRALAGDEVEVFEYHLTLDGHPQYFEARFVRSAADEAFVIIRNITEKRAAEQERTELLRRERDARAAAEQAASRIARLQAVSAALGEALTAHQVAEVAVTQGIAALRAVAGSLAVVNAEGTELEVLSSVGFRPEVEARWRRFPLAMNVPVCAAVRDGEAVFVASVDELIEQFPEAVLNGRPEHNAFASIPLVVEQRVIGAQSLSFLEPREFSESDRAFMLALTRLCAHAMDHARLYDAERAARAESEAAKQRLAFLATAGAQLTASLDYETTLSNLARSMVPYLADWCSVDIAQEDGSIRQLAMAHVDPARASWAHEIAIRYPPPSNGRHGIPRVLHSGRPEIYREVGDEHFIAVAQDLEHLQLMRELGCRSAMILPLSSRGQSFGAMTFVFAESERRYGDEELALAEDLVRHAATAVDNARLYRQAQESNRTKDEFLATLSHELRTPLNAILGWTHLLGSGQLDRETEEQALEAITRSAKSQSQLINDLLDVSRIISGKFELNLVPLDLVPIIRESVETMLPTAQAKSIDLQCWFDEFRVIVLGDANRLQQVAWNLLSNAIKFTPDGGTVSVELRHDEKRARLSVKDSGRGIAPEFLPQVFDRFRQADSTTTRQYGGLGLGLAIARHLSELHGGSIEAASDGLGQGATFTVDLPLLTTTFPHPEGSGVAESALHNGARPAPPQGLLDNTRILVVDDEHDSREMLSRLLTNEQAEVKCASSAEDALQSVRDWTPDIFIFDIAMPGTDGLTLLRQVREMSRHAATPAVAVTAYASDADRERAVSTGFNLYIPKPIRPDNFAPRVSALVSPKTAESSPN